MSLGDGALSEFAIGEDAPPPPPGYTHLFDPAIFDGPLLFDTGQVVAPTYTHLFDPAIFDGPLLFDTGQTVPSPPSTGVTGGIYHHQHWYDYADAKRRLREQLADLPDEAQPAAAQAVVKIADGAERRPAVRAFKAELKAADIDWHPHYAEIVRDIAAQLAHERRMIERDDDDVLLLLH